MVALVESHAEDLLAGSVLVEFASGEERYVQAFLVDQASFVALLDPEGRNEDLVETCLVVGLEEIGGTAGLVVDLEKSALPVHVLEKAVVGNGQGQPLQVGIAVL